MADSSAFLIDPIKVIVESRDRIARLAAIRIFLLLTLPCLVTIALAASFNALNGFALDYLGYWLEEPLSGWFHRALMVLALVELAACVYLGWRAWSENNDIVRTAEEIDRRTTRRQEVVTLASLYRLNGPEKVSTPPLFPVLWARVAAALERFDPASSFRLEIRQPLIRSSFLAAAALVFFGATAFALMTRAGPAELIGHRLAEVADLVGKAETTSGDHQLVSAAHDVAKDLVNPKLPPREKIAELRALERELRKFEASNQGGTQADGSSSRGNGSGSGNGTEGGNGASGLVRSTGSSPSTSGHGRHDSAAQQIVKLQNEISKAQMELQQKTESAQKQSTSGGISSGRAGTGPKSGTNPQQSGSQSAAGAGNRLPQPQPLASGEMASGRNPSSPLTSKGSLGDTHLGEFPEPGNYQRFYQPGEQGPPITIRNARYVTFQLPTATETAGSGPLVTDKSHPQATTPYSNAPLVQQRLAALPDEEQLVPPQYRELIH
jgi:hypothetical protein